MHTYEAVTTMYLTSSNSLIIIIIIIIIDLIALAALTQ